MKTSDEWLRDIHEKADKRFAEQKRRRKMIVSISSSAACLALILCSAIAVLNLIGDNGLIAAVSPESSGTNQTLDNTHNNNSAIGSKPSDNPVVAPPASEVNSGNSADHSDVDTPSKPSIENPSVPSVEPPNDNNNIKLLFAGNKIISKISAAPKYRDPKEYHKEFWSEAQITEYLGVNLAVLPNMPADLTYAQKGDFRILYHNSGEIVEDYQSFIYNGENNRKVEVLVGKVMRPYDCIYNLESNDTTPVSIHGVSHEVLFGVKSNNEDSLKLNFCFADFENGGLYYRIKADNLTAKELYKIVEEIIQLKQ